MNQSLKKIILLSFLFLTMFVALLVFYVRPNDEILVAKNDKIIFYVSTSGLLLFYFISLFVYLQRQVFSPLERINLELRNLLIDSLSLLKISRSESWMEGIFDNIQIFTKEITKLRQREKELSLQQKELLMSFCREMKTPLESVASALKMVTSGISGTVPSPVMGLTKMAEAEIRRELEWINNAISTKLMDSHLIKLECRWKNLQELYYEAQKDIEARYPQSFVDFHFDEIPKSLEVYVDEERLKQVLIHLIANALKYSPQGTSVSLKTDLVADEGILLGVKDQGQGISKEKCHSLFSEISPSSLFEKTGATGSHFGLPLCRAVIESHQGRMGVVTQPGKGTFIYFVLPVWRKMGRDLPFMEFSKAPDEWIL